MTFNFPSRWPNITIKLGSFAVNVPCMFTIVRLSQGVLGLENKLKKAHQHWEGLKEMNYVNYSRKLCFIYKKQLSPWFTCTVSAMSSIHCSFSPWDAAATIRALLPSQILKQKSAPILGSLSTTCKSGTASCPCTRNCNPGVVVLLAYSSRSENYEKSVVTSLTTQHYLWLETNQHRKLNEENYYNETLRDLFK